MRLQLAVNAALAFVIYALSAFVVWEANPAEWTEAGRFWLAVSYALLSFPVAGLVNEVTE